MIRWCSYCQAFLGEIPPFDDPRFTHSICPSCEERLERGENLAEHTAPARSLLHRLMAKASHWDESACVALLDEARASGLSTQSILIGLLKPALYQAGIEWQNGRMSVASEHRFTSWCDRALSILESSSQRRGPPDLLILQAPGNSHSLGPRFAAQILRARGLSVEVVVPELPLDEIVAVAKELRPRIIGFSCALPFVVPGTVDLIQHLRGRLEPGLLCRYVLGGFAFRLGGGAQPLTVAPGIEVVTDLDFFDSLRAESAESGPGSAAGASPSSP